MSRYFDQDIKLNLRSQDFHLTVKVKSKNKIFTVKSGVLRF